MRRQILRVFLLPLLALCLTSMSAADAEGVKADELTFGIVPSFSTRVLFAKYQPLRFYLERRLGQPVRLYTATDFKTFYIKTRDKQYDLVFIAPHMARLAQRQANMVPLARYTQNVRPIVAVPKDSTITTAEDLRGKSIAMIDPLALATLVGVSWLRTHGLEPGRDYRLVNATSHDSAIRSFSKGDNAAAFVLRQGLQQLPKALRDSVKITADMGEWPGAMFMASSNLSSAQIAKLKVALLEFTATTEGELFVKQNGFAGIIPVTQADMDKLDVLALEVDRMLDAPAP